MSAKTLYSGLSFELRHEPDVTVETDGNGVKQAHDLPGHVVLGAVVDGVFVPVLRRKAAGLFADIARAKKAAEAAPPPPATQPEA